MPIFSSVCKLCAPRQCVAADLVNPQQTNISHSQKLAYRLQKNSRFSFGDFGASKSTRSNFFIICVVFTLQFI